MVAPRRTLRRTGTRVRSIRAKGTTSPRTPSSATSRASAQRAPLLLEVGTEELPAGMVESAVAQLADRLIAMLDDHRVAHGTPRTFATPRRLAVIIEALAPKQAALHEEVLGPPNTVAFDSAGKPTKAAEGFAATQGVAVEALETRETPKGVYLCAVKRAAGRSTVLVLKEQLPEIVAGMRFGKSMRWNQSGVRFARPLRWIVALYGSRALRVEVAGVTSGPRSFGHRVLGGGRGSATRGVALIHPSSYEATMKRHAVMADPAVRRAQIREQLDVLAKSAKGVVHPDHYDELLEQAVYAVECPKAVLGSFHSDFLSLPQEVLMTSMREHQGYFSVVKKNGTLLPKFLAVTNMALSNMDVIRAGHERVLTARLSDARFFFDDDRRVSLADRVARLHQVTFHQKLGSLHHKVCRVQQLAAWVCDAVGRQDLKPHAERAAWLAKSDLTTGIVGEFPVLQGVMGREYARHDGEDDVVAEAVGELYRPATPDDAVPESVLGAWLGISDRIDTLVAFFLAGMAPSSSEDPLGLRRVAYGVVRIMVDRQMRGNVAQLVAQAEQIARSQDVIRPKKDIDVQASLIDFLLDRVRYYVRAVHAVRDDVIDAVVAARPADYCDPSDLVARMHAVQAASARPEFDPLMAGYRRAHRIVAKEQWEEAAVEATLFEHEAEHALSQAVDTAHEASAAVLPQQDYQEALAALLALKTPVDRFFDSVMVNAEDARVRANRLSLLRRVENLFTAIADFSRVQVSP